MKNHISKSIIIFCIIVLSSCTSRGINAYKKGDYQTALSELQNSTTNGSADFVDEFCFLGLTYQVLGDSANAEKNMSKAFNICQNNSSDEKDFKKKYPDEYQKLMAYGKNSGYDRNNPSSYQLKNLKWFEIYGKTMGFSKTGIFLVKIPMKISSFVGGNCEVWDNSNHNEYVRLHWTDTNIGNQLKDYAYTEEAFIAYCEIKAGMLYVNFINNK